jgi:hypothetical protein
MERRNLLAQGTTSFTGALILAAAIIQNDNRFDNPFFFYVSFGVVVLLLVNALMLTGAAIFNRSLLRRYAAIVTSTWGFIPLIFFYYSWVMGILELITLGMVAWQVYLFGVIGFLLSIINLVSLFRNGDNE